MNLNYNFEGMRKNKQLRARKKFNEATRFLFSKKVKEKFRENLRNLLCKKVNSRKGNLFKR